MSTEKRRNKIEIKRTIKAVDERGLAERILVLSGRVADIVAVLGATNKTDVGIDFVGLEENTRSVSRTRSLRKIGVGIRNKDQRT
jgi:hypothetical protein